ncbi:YdbL family protein [Archangium lipolyticum]|uniref:YdbL family protein n=1 Tax=Archangium lipolyticum TaxID=2970465 RepID=UPI002149BD25|nr:YdbL family protein [Archangium lipolyticum]
MKRRGLPLLAAFVLSGCIRAPEIVMVDRATALEEQASGSFKDVERRLDRAGMSPTPVPLTPNQLEDLGIQPTPLVENLGKTQADRVDELLRRHCVGEGRDGLLVDTRSQCRAGRLSADDVALVERVNRARRHLWQWMRTVRPGVPEESIRRSWQQVHAEGVICGGWIESDDGTWGEKKC